MLRYLPCCITLVCAVHLRSQNLVAFDLVTDEYGSETIWQLNGLGQTIHIQPGYPDNIGSPSNPQPTITLDLADGTYTFCMSDVYGDGFCCANGQGSMTITHVASGTVLFHTDTFNTDIVCAPFTLPFANVSGRLFLDGDHDCAQGTGELAVPGQVVRVSPGPYYGITDVNGDYEIPLPYGAYTVTAASTHLQAICPASQPVPFALTDMGPFAVVDLGDSSTTRLDIVTTAASGPARPGFQMQYALTVADLSTFTSGPITATFNLDPSLSYIAAVPPPASVVGNVLTWNLASLAPFALHGVHVQAQVPVGLALGTDLLASFNASQTLYEPDLLNNSFQVQTEVTGSVDPNDKLVWPRDVYTLGTDSILDYTIRFQNTGTDTAFTVVVTDTLGFDLDMSTFEHATASHPCTVHLKPGRVVDWHFNNILLPDSTTNEPRSHGLVSFRIRPVQPLLPGTVISNNADIFFDFNPPVRTNDAVVVAETSTQVAGGSGSGQGLRVFPNPVSDQLNFALPGIAVPYVVELVGIDGRVISRERTALGQVDVCMLPAGLYALRVNGAVARFVKR